VPRIGTCGGQAAGPRYGEGPMLFIGLNHEHRAAFCRVWARLARLLRIFGGAAGG
jgi:hypothetical protein